MSNDDRFRSLDFDPPPLPAEKPKTKKNGLPFPPLQESLRAPSPVIFTVTGELIRGDGMQILTPRFDQAYFVHSAVAADDFGIERVFLNRRFQIYDGFPIREVLVKAAVQGPGLLEISVRRTSRGRGVPAVNLYVRALNEIQRQWTGADGVTRQISEMTDAHVVNTIRYLLRTGSTPVQLDELIKEAMKRGIWEGE